MFTTLAELRAVLPSVPKNNAESLLSFADTAAALHLAPSLGQGLLDQLSALPATGADARLVLLRDKLRRPLAYYIALEAGPQLAVSLNDLGMTEASTAQAAPSRQWVYNNWLENTSSTADKLLDLALAWLDAHAADYADELDSPEYRSRASLLVASADELGRYVATGGSRRFFLALLPSLRQVEDFEVSELLGEALLEQLREGLASGQAPAADTRKLLGLLRPYVAHLALSQGVMSLSVALTGVSLRLLSDNEAVRQRQALGPEQLSALSQQAASTAEKWRAKLATYLDAQRAAATPAWPTVSAELYDNAGKASFWV